MSNLPLQYIYARGKLGEALEILATDPGDIKERLTIAMNAIAILQERDFPAKLRAGWRSILRESTAHGPLMVPGGSITLGAVSNTMHRVRRARAAGIAKKIWMLYGEVSHFVESLGR